MNRNLVLLASLLAGACGDDAAGTSESLGPITTLNPDQSTGTTDEPTTSGNSTTDELPTTTGVDPSHPDGSASDSGTGTTGETACAVTCQQILDEEVNWYDKADHLDDKNQFIDPCEAYGSKLLNWEEAIEVVDSGELAKTLCLPFDPELNTVTVNVSELGKMTDAQKLSVRCMEFLGAIEEIPENHQDPVCLADVQQIISYVETLGQYQTIGWTPDEFLPVLNEYDTIAKVNSGSFKGFAPAYVQLNMDWGGVEELKLCHVEMTHVTMAGQETFIGNDMAVQTGANQFFPPNQGVVPPGYNIFEVKCSLSGYSGVTFYADVSLVDSQSELSPVRIDNDLYDGNEPKYIISP